jgi:hypothetical protein
MKIEAKYNLRKIIEALLDQLVMKVKLPGQQHKASRTQATLDPNEFITRI